MDFLYKVYADKRPWNCGELIAQASIIGLLMLARKENGKARDTLRKHNDMISLSNISKLLTTLYYSSTPKEPFHIRNHKGSEGQEDSAKIDDLINS